MKKRSLEPEVHSSFSLPVKNKGNGARSSTAQSWNTTLKAVSIMMPAQLLHLGMEIPPANSFPSEFVMKRGYLMRLESRRPLSRLWQKRFCVLSRNKIYFYKNERSTGVEKSSSCIDLSEYCRCQRNIETTKAGDLPPNDLNEFTIHPSRRKIFGSNTVTLATEDLIEAEEWIIQIQKAIYSIHCQESPVDKKAVDCTKDSKESSRLVKTDENLEYSNSQCFEATSSLSMKRPPPPPPGMSNLVIEGTLERSSTSGKPFPKGFESNRDSTYLQSKSKLSTKDLTYAYSSSSSNNDDDSFDDSFISPSMVNETRATPKSPRASYVQQQQQQPLQQHQQQQQHVPPPVLQLNDSPSIRRIQMTNSARNSRMWSPVRVQQQQQQQRACQIQDENEDDQFLQTLAEDELRSGTPAESVAEGSELNESFIFQSEKNGKIVGRHRTQTQKGSALIEENVSQLSKEVAELKRISQRLEQDLLGAKNDVGNVQESLAQVQASAETIAERVDRFANQMRQLERQAINIINELKVKSDQLDQKLLSLDSLQLNAATTSPTAIVNNSTTATTTATISDCNANKNFSPFGNLDSSTTFATNPNWPCFRFGEGGSGPLSSSSTSGSQTFPKNKHIYSTPTRKSDPSAGSFLFPSPDSTVTRKNSARHSVQICQDPHHGNSGKPCSSNPDQQSFGSSNLDQRSLGLTGSSNLDQRSFGSGSTIPDQRSYGLNSPANPDQRSFGLVGSTNPDQRSFGLTGSSTESKPRFAITPSTMAQVVSLNQCNNNQQIKPK